jgi:hypothetical protein
MSWLHHRTQALNRAIKSKRCSCIEINHCVWQRGCHTQWLISKQEHRLDFIAHSNPWVRCWNHEITTLPHTMWISMQEYRLDFIARFNAWVRCWNHYMTSLPHAMVDFYKGTPLGFYCAIQCLSSILESWHDSVATRNVWFGCRSTAWILFRDSMLEFDVGIMIWPCCYTHWLIPIQEHRLDFLARFNAWVRCWNHDMTPLPHAMADFDAGHRLDFIARFVAWERFWNHDMTPLPSAMVDFDAWAPLGFNCAIQGLSTMLKFWMTPLPHAMVDFDTVSPLGFYCAIQCLSKMLELWHDPVATRNVWFRCRSTAWILLRDSMLEFDVGIMTWPRCHTQWLISMQEHRSDFIERCNVRVQCWNHDMTPLPHAMLILMWEHRLDFFARFTAWVRCWNHGMTPLPRAMVDFDAGAPLGFYCAVQCLSSMLEFKSISIKRNQ